MKRRLAHALIFSALASAAAAAEVPLYSRLLTSDPAPEYDPTISADGKWLVFVRENNGIPNLFRMQLDDRPRAAQAYLPHPASTYSPVFSPVNKSKLAFVSQRTDALGDVFIVDFPDGKPATNTQRGIRDEIEGFAPNSDKLLTTTYAADGSTKGAAEGLVQRNQTPEPPFPFAGKIHDAAAALLRADDTNRDGKLGEGDDPSVWMLDGNTWRQASVPLRDARGIALNPRNREIIVAARWIDSQDIGVLADNPLRASKDAAALLAAAQQEQDRNGYDSELAIALHRAAFRASQTGDAKDAAALGHARGLNRAGRFWQAARFYEQNFENVSQQASRRLRAQFLSARFDLTAARRQQSPYDLAPDENIAGSLGDLRDEFLAAGLQEDAAEVQLTLSRIDFGAKDYLAAAKKSEDLLTNYRGKISEDLLCRAVLFRSQLFSAMGLGPETDKALLTIFEINPKDESIREEAAERLIGNTATRAPEPESQILEIRKLLPQAEPYPYLTAKLRTAEARLLVQTGSANEAILPYRAAAVLAAQAPTPGVIAAEELAKLRADSNAFAESIATLSAVEAALAPSEDESVKVLRARVHRELVSYYLAKGRRELSLGDPLLATSTYNDLLKIEPESVQGWRGKIGGLSTQPEFFAQTIEQYKKEAKANSSDALAWYKYGLAASYPRATDKDTLKAVQRAVTLDPSVPYFHLTEGFIDEQIFGEAEAKGRTDYATLEKAAAAYEQALALLPPGDDPQARADVLLNSANAALGLKQYFKANDLFRERGETKVPFPDTRTELLYHWNGGIAAYQSSDPFRSDSEFLAALATLDGMAKSAKIEAARADSIRLELIGRRALALMDVERNDEAQKLFDEIYEKSPDNSMARVRAQRNSALLLEKTASQLSGVARADALRQAEATARKALDDLNNPALKSEPQYSSGSGLINLSLAFTSDAGGGGSKLDFDKKDEERLLRATLGRIAERQGQRETAIASLRKQLELDPTIDDTNRAYYYSIRSVTLSRMAAEAARAGRNSEALQDAEKALSLSQFKIVDIVTTNSNSSTLLLAQISEILGADPSQILSRDPAVYWMLQAADLAEKSDWALLDRAAERLQDYQDPAAPPALLIVAPVETARLTLVRALAQERLFAAALGTKNAPGLDQLRSLATAKAHALAAANFAASLRTLADGVTDTEEIFRLSILANTATLRIAEVSGDATGADKTLADLVAFARDAGYEDMTWWIQGQAALSAQDPVRRATLAEAALTTLESSPLLKTTQNDVFAWNVLDAVESLQIAALAADKKAEDLWTATDHWRVVRLRWLAEGSGVTTISPEEKTWFDRIGAAQKEIAEARLSLRKLPLASDRSGVLKHIDERGKFIDKLLADGRAKSFPVVDYLHPEAIGFEAVSALLEPPFLTSENPLFVLDRNINGVRVRAVYTPTGAQVVSTSDPLPASQRPVFFGEPVADRPAGSVEVLTSFGFYKKFEHLTLRVKSAPTVFPPDAKTTHWENDLQLASSLQVNPAIIATGFDPASWPLQGRNMPLSQVFQYARNLDRAEVTLAPPAGYRPQEIRAQQLALAAYLDAQGVTEARIDGADWLGIALDPRQVPAIAQDELATAQGALVAALDKNQNDKSVRSIEKIILLKEALDQKDGLAIDYANLAQVRGRVGRWKDAADAARRAFEINHESGATVAELAASQQVLANTATHARDWETALPAYEESARLYAEAGDAPKRIEVVLAQANALEIAGRYKEAVALSTTLREQIAATDVEQALGIDYRLARLNRVYLSRYAEAEKILRAASDTARANNLGALDRSLRIDLARVLQSTARFEEAEKILDEVEAAATAAGEQLQVAEVQLERANMHWLRSEYFESFTAQQKLLKIPGVDQRFDLQIAEHNVAGLTAWAINDLDRAFDEINRALTLAEKIESDPEIASSCNNMGLVFRSQAKYDDALHWFGRSLELDEIEENRWGQAYSLRNIGITNMLAGDPAASLDPLNRAVTLTTDIGDEVNMTKALLARGDALALLKRNAEAIPDYNAALEKSRAIPIPEMEWRALFGLARISLAENREDEALAQYAAAIDVVDNLRASIRVEEFQNGFLLDKQELYNQMIALQLKRGQTAQALEFSEKARGRNFIDLLGNRRLNLGKIDDQQLVDREHSLRSEIERLERSMAAADNNDERAKIESQLKTLRADYSDFLIVLRTNDPELASFLRVEPVTVAELQKLLEPDTRLVIYHMLPDQCVIWLLGPTDLQLFQVPVSAKELTDEVASARVSLQNVEDSSAQMKTLADKLIAPILPSLAGVKRIGIVPHQQLHTLPFAALPTGPNEYLVDRVALFYAPSASVLRYTIARRGDRADSNKVLGFGNPDRGKDMNLPFAQKEAERLAFDFPQVTVRTGNEATESWLVNNFQDYGIIHIASHGEYRPDTPLFSAVMLAPDIKNDGILSAQEIFSLQTRADLITLSACQSGLGRVSSGDDIIGLNRAFVYAGTRQLMTTLWRVDDISTAVLFKYFYRNVNEMDRAEALRQAQIRLKARPEYQHPAQWAGLVLSGDWK
ncbi:hypothetical protein BH09SUM1_BH09SUM1_03230 [soil metagenome]